MARRRAADAEAELNLPPGFRFHPTDEELVVHYLCKKVAYQRLPVPIIAEVDLYKYDPWQLPEMALFGQQEWYFFTPRDRKYPNGSRPNRAAGTGYWKATGADKPVTPEGRTRPVGVKKALVFYSGKAPRGVKTDWIMHEYRLADTDRSVANKKGNLRLDEWVLCRLYHKKNNWVKKQEEAATATAVASSFKETTTLNSFGGAVDDTGSDSFCRSDIENESFFHPPQAYNGAQGAARASVAEVQVKEDNDWFMDLNLDDLQSPFGNFGSSTTADVANQEYYFQVLDSPQMKWTLSLANRPPF